MKYNNQESGLPNSYYKDYELRLSTICGIPRPQIKRYLSKNNNGRKTFVTNFSIDGFTISCSIFLDLPGYKEIVFKGKESDCLQQFEPSIKAVIEDKPIPIILASIFSQSTVLEEAYRTLNKKSRKKFLEFNKLTCSNLSNREHNIKIEKYFLELFERTDSYLVTIGQIDSIISVYQHSETSLNFPGRNATKMKEEAGKIISQKLNEEFDKE